jgi:hypothetical protein
MKIDAALVLLNQRFGGGEASFCASITSYFFGPRGSMVSGRHLYVVEKLALTASVTLRLVAALRIVSTGAVAAKPLLPGVEFTDAVVRRRVARVELVHRDALHDPQHPRALGGHRADRREEEQHDNERGSPSKLHHRLPSSRHGLLRRSGFSASSLQI